MNRDNIVENIHFVRGVNVMLDQDLAMLYGVQTRVLKQAVRRNIKRFPVDFMFELTSCDLKAWPAFKIPAIRLYRTGCCHALKCIDKRQGNICEY